MSSLSLSLGLKLCDNTWFGSKHDYALWEQRSSLGDHVSISQHRRQLTGGKTLAAYLVVGIREKAEDCSFTRPQGLHMDHGTGSSLLKGTVQREMDY
jgi:hypothetical protein